MAKEKNKELIINEDNSLKTIPSQSSDLNTFLQRLIDSHKLPVHVKTVDDAFTIVQMGKELGFPTMQALHYIIPIQGKLSLSAKAMGALLRRGGVKYTTLEDAAYVYSDGTVTDYPKEGDAKPIDRRTTILFTRDEQNEKVSYSWKDAVSAGLSTKDNWTRMPKEMLFARCLTKGANRIAPDLLFGLYSTDELYDAFDKGNINVKRDDEGSIVEIIN